MRAIKIHVTDVTPHRSHVGILLAPSSTLGHIRPTTVNLELFRLRSKGLPGTYLQLFTVPNHLFVCKILFGCHLVSYWQLTTPFNTFKSLVLTLYYPKYRISPEIQVFSRNSNFLTVNRRFWSQKKIWAPQKKKT
jgi:hypothetical protein